MQPSQHAFAAFAWRPRARAFAVASLLTPLCALAELPTPDWDIDAPLLPARPATALPAPAPAPPPEPAPEPAAGSRAGVVSFAGASYLNDRKPGSLHPDFGGEFGVGFRIGVAPRPTAPRAWAGSIASVVGVTLARAGYRPFLESRIELGSVSPGGLWQPNFMVWAAGGVSTFAEYTGPVSSVAPHVGVGLGWNWLPRNFKLNLDGGGSVVDGFKSFGAVGIVAGVVAGGVVVAAAAVAAFVFTGKLELRYTQDQLRGPGILAVTIGYGT